MEDIGSTSCVFFRETSDRDDDSHSLKLNFAGGRPGLPEIAWGRRIAWQGSVRFRSLHGGGPGAVVLWLNTPLVYHTILGPTFYH